MKNTNLFDDIVEEDYLRQLHGEVIFIGARLQVADHRRSDAERRNEEAGDDEVCGFACFRVHQQQRDVFIRNPPEQVQDHQGIQVFLEEDFLYIYIIKRGKTLSCESEKSAYLCSVQQRFDQFVVFDGCIEGLHEL